MRVYLEVKLIKLLATQPLQAPIRRNPAVPVNKLQWGTQTSYYSRVLCIESKIDLKYSYE